MQTHKCCNSTTEQVTMSLTTYIRSVLGKRVTALLLTLLCLSATTCAAARRAEDGSRSVAAVLDSVFALSARVGNERWHYTGHYYYRGVLDLQRKNFIVASVPNRRFYMKGGRELMTEDWGEVEYTMPRTFTRKVRQRSNSTPRYAVAHGYIMDFFNVSLHSVYLLGDHILSPLRRENRHSYRYSLDSISCGRAYIACKRRRRNMQLVDAYIIYNMEQGHISSVKVSGMYNFVDFTMTVDMGTRGLERYWPQRTSLDFRYWYYGNVFRGSAVYTQTYSGLTPDYTPPLDTKNPHDITSRYALALDTAAIRHDRAFMDSLRPIPLSPEELRLYRETEGTGGGTDSLHAATPQQRSGGTPKWIKSIGHVGEFFFNDHDLMTTAYSSLKVLSPNLGYSGSRGVSWRQDIEYAYQMSNGRRWSIVPRATYYFKDGELTGRVRSELLFNPKHLGSAAFEAGMQQITANSNTLYFVSEVGPDGKENVEALDFTDFYWHADIKREVANGLDLSTGIVMHHYRPRRYARTHSAELGLRERYREFATRLTASYTPRQDYYMVGTRKVRVESSMPTFTVSYERGIKGVLGSSNNFEKWETMVTQSRQLTPLHRMIWKLGGGMFTDKENRDFLQYEYFNNGITAYNWDDDRSGVFQLLDQKYYHNSYHYLRGHVVMESPILVLGNFNTHLLRAERLYVNALLTEGLVPYVEFGYGISNEMFDISVFGGCIKGETFKTGLKFSLHIFD